MVLGVRVHDSRVEVSGGRRLEQLTDGILIHSQEAEKAHLNGEPWMLGSHTSDNFLQQGYYPLILLKQPPTGDHAFKCPSLLGTLSSKSQQSSDLQQWRLEQAEESDRCKPKAASSIYNSEEILAVYELSKKWWLILLLPESGPPKTTKRPDPKQNQRVFLFQVLNQVSHPSDAAVEQKRPRATVGQGIYWEQLKVEGSGGLQGAQ